MIDDKSKGATKDESDLVESINDSAKHIAAATFTFLITLVYLGISAAATTDDMLLVGTSVVLPIFSVGVPVLWFFSVAPVLILILHLNILLQEYLLVRKVAGLSSWRDDSLFFPSLSVNRMFGQEYNNIVRLLFVGLSGCVLFILPVASMLLIFLRFLPYHHDRIAPFNAVLLAADLLMIWLFFVMIAGVKRKATARPKRAVGAVVLRILSGLILLYFTVSVGFLLFRLREIVFRPRAITVCGDARERFLLFPYRRNLSLKERGLVAGEPAPDLLELYRVSGEPVNELVRRNTKGVHLVKRNLACADFSGSTLVNADFRGAILRGARFDDADLRGANFAPAGTLGRALEEMEYSLTPDYGRTANRTDLSGATFRNADLRHSVMVSSVANGSDFHRAKLQEVDLRSAELERSNFSEAELQAANLSNASLRGANLWRSVLSLSNLAGAKLEFAQFTESRLEFVDFQGARSDGADFRNAFLQNSSGLILVHSDLRGAKLGGADFCYDNLGRPLAFPYLSDLRNLSFSPLKVQGFTAEFKRTIGVPLLEGNRKRIEALRDKRSTCMAPLLYGPVEMRKFLREQFSGRYLLYDADSRYLAMQGWPKQPIDVESFYELLAEEMVQQACSSQDSYQLLSFRLMNTLGPSSQDLRDAVRTHVSQGDGVCESLRELGEVLNIDKLAERTRGTL